MRAYEGPFSDDDVVHWLARMRQRYMADGMALWAVELRDTAEMVGQCGAALQPAWGAPDGRVFPGSAGPRVVEVGYLFARDHWHRGFATEAARACRDWAFENLDVDAVHSHVRDTNLASMNVAIRLGMLARGRFTKTYRDVTMPHIDFRIERDRWRALSSRPA